MADEIELTSDPLFSKIEENSGLRKTITVTDFEGKFVLKYTQTIEFSEVLTDQDLMIAQNSMDHAQDTFLQSLKGTY